jgi:hypothetical protein
MRYCDVRNQKALADILPAAQDLERLDSTIPKLVDSSAQSRVSAIIMTPDSQLKQEPIFRCLTVLRRGARICQESELVGLLHLHNKTLRWIYLRDVSSTKNEDARTHCWMRVLENTRTAGPNVQLEGHFTKHERQWWFVDSKQPISPNCLKSAVSGWLRREEDTCPIEIATGAVSHPDVDGHRTTCWKHSGD